MTRSYRITRWISQYAYEAIWKAVSILGDRDTICAIVGGITIMSTDENRIPKEWMESVEDFETSKFIKKENGS